MDVGEFGIFAPNTLATAASNHHSTDSGFCNCGQVLLVQALVLAPKTEIEGIQTAAFFFITEDGEVLARLFHQLGQSNSAVAAACFIGGASGKQQGCCSS